MTRIKFTALALAALIILCGENNDQILNAATPGGEPDLSAAANSADDESSGQKLVALTASNWLLQFNSNLPRDINSRKRVTGLQEGEKLLGIDFRPFNSRLYGLGSTSRLYVIDLATGVAAPVGSGPFTPRLQDGVFGFDFNPAVDRVRIVSNTGQNLRLHPDLGTVVDSDPNTSGVQQDGRLAYATTDANAVQLPGVVGAAYTNPDNDPATATILYNIDAAINVLVTQNPPNNGTLNTVGALGFDLRNKQVGFDIAASGTGHAVFWNEREKRNQLMTVNLATGECSRLGVINSNEPITSLAAPMP